MSDNTRRDSGPLVPLAGLYENVSGRTGATYFMGYLGKAKLVMLKARDAKEGEPGWTLYVQERPPKAGGTGGGAAGARDAVLPFSPPHRPVGSGGGMAA